MNSALNGQQIDFFVRRDKLQASEFVARPLAEADLPDRSLLLKVDRFAFTANNITYAMLGDQLKYWNFFPAPDGLGSIPVWGFGEVLRSRNPAISEGELFFGYLPMATHAVLTPVKVGERGFVEGSAHRQELPPVYNSYARVTNDPAFAGRQGDYQALVRPVYMLSFLVDDYLAENEFFGARVVLLTSASSKTAIGLAHLLHLRKQIEVIGLTSTGNKAFVESLGCYHRVVAYDDLSPLDAKLPAAMVDMAGNAKLRAAIHNLFRDNLKCSCLVGFTHHEDREHDGESLPGAKPQWFFAPDQIRKRAKDWGPGGVEKRFSAAWASVAGLLERSLKIVHGNGKTAVQAVYRETLAGKAKPNEGHILSLWD